MSAINDGGPAFPSGLIDPSTPEDAVQSLHKGMTVRQYIAIKAMQSLMSDNYVDRSKPHNQKNIAVLAYQIADAMLREGAA